MRKLSHHHFVVRSTVFQSVVDQKCAHRLWYVFGNGSLRDHSFDKEASLSRVLLAHKEFFDKYAPVQYYICLCVKEGCVAVLCFMKGHDPEGFNVFFNREGVVDVQYLSENEVKTFAMWQSFEEGLTPLQKIKRF